MQCCRQPLASELYPAAWERQTTPDAVVDAHGRVHGVENLLVADASVMPVVPTTNTNIPTLMIAERIASELSAASSIKVSTRAAAEAITAFAPQTLSASNPTTSQ